ncbi:MAG: response regulator [Acidimicrobiia bacterium]|nr:response regulator [Acidimicrobiia bacterium]NNF09670.1 response regulator [Acidimicrobiia bacterium]NNL68767.1 response regulator [Acidimicrobiia bacterium]
MDATVLIVEDSPSVRRLIEVSIRPLGVTVIEAEDGIGGLEAARREVPDIILLDIGLPGIDGWEVLRELRADTRTADIAVIIVTAHAQPEVAAAAERRGADGFITKPFRPGELREEIVGLIGGGAEIRETG